MYLNNIAIILYILKEQSAMLRNKKRVSFDITKNELYKLNQINKKYHISKSNLIRSLIDTLNYKSLRKSKNDSKFIFNFYSQIITKLNSIRSILSNYNHKLKSLSNLSSHNITVLSNLHSIIMNVSNELNNDANEIADNNLNAVEYQLKLDGNKLDSVINHKNQFRHNKILINKLNRTDALIKHAIQFIQIKQ